MNSYRSRLIAVIGTAAVSLMPVTTSTADDLQKSLDVVEATNRSAERSQQKIDALSRETRIMLEEYRSLKESSEYQDAYQRELELLDASQQARIEALNREIAQARITRQRILPLMRSMVDALEQFVVLDLPFHHEDRIAAVMQLRQRLDRPDLSVSARFRLLLEGFQIEQNYSQTVEAWRGPLQREQDQLSVEFLRLGRVALYYQTLDREQSAYWDNNEQRWQPLASEYNRSLAAAMRVARSEAAPALLELPFPGRGS